MDAVDFAGLCLMTLKQAVKLNANNVIDIFARRSASSVALAA